MFEVIRTESRKKENKTHPEKKSIEKVHPVSDKGVPAVVKYVQNLKNLKSPEKKTDGMRILGSLGF